ncbi:MAG: insulinase family protein, partial [Ignavibacteriaceae bacterium]|nr:insulinase family protein [Ignavibacteriaceae bacterium]
ITGISHVVEHLMFKGTPKYGKGEASKTISNNSGIFNAFTSNDMTSYYEYLPANKIEIAMEIESDRMQNSSFNPDEFLSEVQVIKQERRMRSESKASGILNEMMNAIAYDSHPNRDPIIGWPSDLDVITRDQAYDYYKTHYTPNNSVLVLVGDFDTDEILKLVNKYYGSIPSGPDVKEITVVEQPQKVRKTFTLYHADNSNPLIRMAFHVPTYQSPDAAALRMAGMILCERSRDARLYKRLIETEKIATSASGGFGMAKDPGLFQITVGCRPDSSLERAEAIVWEELKKMQDETVSDHELQKVKNRYQFNQVSSYQKNADIGTRMSRYEAYFGYEMLDDFEKRLLAVKKEDIQSVMNKYFQPDMVTVAYAYPKPGAVKDSIAVGAHDEEGDIESLNETFPGSFFFTSPVEEKIMMDAIAHIPDDDIIKPKPIAPMIKTIKLDNGITIYAIENHLTPTISIAGIIETGLIPEALEGGKPGISTLLADVINRGTEELSYDEMNERMAFVPFSFGVNGSYNGIFFTGNSLLKDADEMMDVGFDLLTKPGLRNEDIEKLRPRHIISAKNRFKQTGMKAFYYMYNILFEGHPYTQYNSTVESLKSITRDDLSALHHKYFRPDRTSILMVGDMTVDEMKVLANKYFGNWSSDSDAPEMINTPPVKEVKMKEIKVFPEKDYTECTINIGFSPFNNIAPDEDEIVAVLNYILAGSALTSRMGIELRDKQGLIYGIKSELWKRSDKIGYWKFNTKTAPQNVEKVITGIFKEINKLFDGNITDEELSSAKNRQLGLLPFYVETPDDAAQIVFNAMRDNESFDQFDNKAERIVKISKEDVMRIAHKYLTVDNYIIVVDGPIEENSLDHLKDEI